LGKILILDTGYWILEARQIIDSLIRTSLLEEGGRVDVERSDDGEMSLFNKKEF